MKYVASGINSEAAYNALDKIIKKDLALTLPNEIDTISSVLVKFLSFYVCATKYTDRFDVWAFNDALKNLFSSSKLFFMRFSFNKPSTELILAEFIKEYVSQSTPKEEI